MRAMRAFTTFIGHKHGMSAVEFALMAPVFCLIFAGVGDFGGALYAKFGVEGAVSAAANYTLLNAASVNSTSGTNLANNLALILASAHSTNWATGSIVVNNGPAATVNSSGTVTPGGTAANADKYYCPTGSGAGMTWGTGAVTQSTACTGGTSPGKFVTIVATKTYSPIFSSYGLIKSGTISASAVVETQ